MQEPMFDDDFDPLGDLQELQMAYTELVYKHNRVVAQLNDLTRRLDKCEQDMLIVNTVINQSLS